MKQTFIFTSDNSFTHIKDKMHQSVAEHIVQNDQTKELYHYVVSYGSSFNISHSSIFMSHLLKMIGLTGFAVAYSADNSNIVLPYYPYKMPENKSLVEVPKNISLNEINFEYSHKPVSKDFESTFLGKKYFITHKNKGIIQTTGEELLKNLFGCFAFRLCEFTQQNESYPFFCVFENMNWNDQKDLKEILTQTDVLENNDIRQALQNFVKIDISKAIKILEEETRTEQSELTSELIQRQEIIKEYLTKQNIENKENYYKN